MHSALMSSARRAARFGASAGGGGYSPAARVAALLAHPTYGSMLAANHGDFTNANGGLALPTAPTGPFTDRFVSTIADVNTYLNGEDQNIVLTPGTYSGHITYSTGGNNKLDISGCTINPTDDNLTIINCSGGSATGPLYVTGGGTAVCNNGYAVYNGSTLASDIHIYGVTFRGAGTLVGVVDNFGDGGQYRATRFLMERCSVLSADGTAFGHTGAANCLFMNCELLVPHVSNGAHENPFRANGCHLVGTIDCRLRTYLDSAPNNFTKHCWRSHRSYGSPDLSGGVAFAINCQFESGGIFCDYPGVYDEGPQTSRIILDGNMNYTDDSIESGVYWNVPHLNTYTEGGELEFNGTTMNAYLYADGNRWYNNNFSSPGANILSSNVPPGVNTNSVTAAYTSTPAWSFYTFTPS